MSEKYLGDGKKPKFSRSQLIGQKAFRSLMANQPGVWLTTQLDGDTDLGLDLNIQVLDGEEAVGVFRAQLKGSEAPDLNVSGDQYSVKLSLSTANYYVDIVEPILLILCDLSIDPDNPAACPLYYAWVHEELKAIREQGIAENQESVTFHIPKANRISSTTDLLPYIVLQRNLSGVGDELFELLPEQLHQASPLETSKLIAGIPSNISRRGASFFASIIKEPTRLWPEAPHGSIPWHIQQAEAHLKSGDAEKASASLAQIEPAINQAADLEQIEFWHQKGRLHSYMSQEEPAAHAFGMACELSNDSPRHLVAWVEARIRLLRLDGPTGDLEDLLGRLKGEQPEIISIRSRCLAILGKFREAEVETENLVGVSRAVSRSILFLMQSQFERTIESCNEGLHLVGVEDRTRLALTIIRARATFGLCLGTEGRTSNLVIPISGPAGANTDLLHKLWIDVSDAVRMLRADGWSSNLELIADVWGVSAGMLGKFPDVVDQMAEAAARRPHCEEIQAVLESVALHLGRFPLALEANTRQSTNPQQIFRRIHLLNLLGKHRECVQLFSEAEGVLDLQAPQLGLLLMIAMESAKLIMNFELYERLKVRLVNDPDLAAFVGIEELERDLEAGTLDRLGAIEKQVSKYGGLDLPQELLLRIWHALSATTPEEARMLLALAPRVQQIRLFDLDETLRLAQAHLTLGMWQELLPFAEEGLRRFQNSKEIKAVYAVALDHSGRTFEAQQLLLEEARSLAPLPWALRGLLLIARRLRNSELEIECLERLLPRLPDRKGQLECLAALFRVVRSADPSTHRLFGIAKRIGDLVDQTDEHEEGFYLGCMIQLPNSGSSRDEQSVDITVVQARFEAFFNRFPGSRILNRVEVPADPTSEQFLSALQQAIGPRNPHPEAVVALREAFRSGALQVPFSWRPGNFLEEVSNLIDLWERCKTGTGKGHEFTLRMSSGEWQPMRASQVKHQIPLLDSTTLLVLHDLDLMDALLEVFPRIAVGKATLAELSATRNHLVSSPATRSLDGILSFLNGRLDRVLLPEALDAEEADQAPWRAALDEIENLARSGDYLLYIDDEILRGYISRMAQTSNSICTMDVLSVMEELGVCPPRVVAAHVAKLAGWHVGLMIPYKLQFEILPAELASISTVHEGVELLRGSTPCKEMFGALWGSHASMKELMLAVKPLAQVLLAERNLSPIAIAAVMTFWHGIVSTHKEPSGPISTIPSLFLLIAAGPDLPESATVSRLWEMYRLMSAACGLCTDRESWTAAVRFAARLVADLDENVSTSGRPSLAPRLRLGLTPGSTEAVEFEAAYAQRLSALREQAVRGHRAGSLPKNGPAQEGLGKHEEPEAE